MSLPEFSAFTPDTTRPLPCRLAGVLDSTPPSLFHCLGRSNFQSAGRPTRISSADSLVCTGVGIFGGTDLPLRLAWASAASCIHKGVVENIPSARNTDRLFMLPSPKHAPRAPPDQVDKIASPARLGEGAVAGTAGGVRWLLADQTARRDKSVEATAVPITKALICWQLLWRLGALGATLGGWRCPPRPPGGRARCSSLPRNRALRA